MKILDILNRTKDEKQSAANTRVAKALSRGQEALIDRLEAKRDDLEAKKEKLLNIDASSVKQDTWNNDYHDAILELELIGKEIEIAKRIKSELFSEVSIQAQV